MGERKVLVKQSESRWFMYADSSERAHLLPDSAPDEHLAELSALALYNAIMSVDASQYTYFTAPLSSVSPSLAVLASREAGRAHKMAEANMPLDDLNVWIGSSGCCTQAH